MLTINGKQFRNLTEQVAYLTECYAQGVIINTDEKVSEAELLPPATSVMEGYTVAVGESAPYDYYLSSNGSWVNLGTFPAKGDTGADGQDGYCLFITSEAGIGSGTSELNGNLFYNPSSIDPKPGDVVLGGSEMNIYVITADREPDYAVEWRGMFKGDQGEAGYSIFTTSESGVDDTTTSLDTTKFYNPESIRPRNGDVVLGGSDYNVYIISAVSGTTATVTWSGALKGYVDTTLTQAGYPADAKAVGDAIDEVNDIFENYENATIENVTLRNYIVDSGTPMAGHYFTRNSSTNTIVDNTGTGTAWVVNLKKFIGGSVNVKYTTNGTSGRLTALCDEDGKVAKFDTEGSMSANGFDYNITDEYYMLYISYDPGRSSNLVVTLNRENEVPSIIADLGNFKESVIGGAEINNLVIDTGSAITGHYYSRNSLTNKIVDNAGHGTAYAIDLSKYKHGYVTVKFDTTSTGGRLTALCDSAGDIKDYNTEGSMTLNGFTYYVSDNYYMLYISFDPSRSEALSVIYNKKSEYDIGNDTYYVATSGNNENDGSADHPFATLGYAIAYGAKNICILPGTYKQSIDVTGKDGLRIFGYYGSYASGEYGKPFFTNGDFQDIAGFTLTDGVYSKAFTIDSAKWAGVFISHTIAPTTTGSRPSYNAGLFANYADKYDDLALLPVLTTDDLVDNSFTWDGTTLYVKVSTSTDLQGFTSLLDTDYIFALNKCNDLTVENIKIGYARSTDFRIRQCNGVEITNCEFGYSLLSDNVSTDYCNTVFTDCNSYKARNDGFNCHYYGESVYNNCKALYNGDDGESSHEYCKVIVNGGEYAHNFKGGHSPVNGCKFAAYNTYAHHNEFGVYVRSDGTYDIEPIYIFGSLLTGNNTRSVDVTGYEVNLVNCKIDNKNATSGGTINEVSFGS